MGVTSTGTVNFLAAGSAPYHKLLGYTLLTIMAPFATTLSLQKGTLFPLQYLPLAVNLSTYAISKIVCLSNISIELVSTTFSLNLLKSMAVWREIKELLTGWLSIGISGWNVNTPVLFKTVWGDTSPVTTNMEGTGLSMYIEFNGLTHPTFLSQHLIFTIRRVATNIHYTSFFTHT